MATPKKLKMKKSTKKVVKTEINEGTYVDTKVNNTRSGGSGGDGAGYSSSNVQAPADPISAIYDTPAKNGGKMAISELPGQYTKPIPVPLKPKKPAPKKARPTAK
jgi:hypothetical protein